MASILAPGTTPGSTSTDVVVPVNSNATIGIYVASGDLPKCSFDVMIATPGADIRYATLSNERPAVGIGFPCTARVVRNGTSGVAVGAFSVEA